MKIIIGIAAGFIGLYGVCAIFGSSPSAATVALIFFLPIIRAIKGKRPKNQSQNAVMEKA